MSKKATLKVEHQSFVDSVSSIQDLQDVISACSRKIHALKGQAKKPVKISYSKPSKAKQKIEFQKELIANPTKAEKRFSDLLTEHSIQFKFQNNMLGYFPDFYLPSYKLIIEIDGDYHQSEEQKEKDKIRTSHLEAKGKHKVIRFTNDEVFNNSLACIEKIREYER